MYLLDTNTLIYFFKGMGEVSNNLFLRVPKDIYVPSVVVYELEVGITKSQNPQKRMLQLEKLLSQVNVISFGAPEAKAAARIRAELEKSGQSIGPIDTLIAGCAVAHNLILVTHNVKEFTRVASLKVEDWF